VPRRQRGGGSAALLRQQGDSITTPSPGLAIFAVWAGDLRDSLRLRSDKEAPRDPTHVHQPCRDACGHRGRDAQRRVDLAEVPRWRLVS
jgi:hypothetical protein